MAWCAVERWCFYAFMLLLLSQRHSTSRHHVSASAMVSFGRAIMPCARCRKRGQCLPPEVRDAGCVSLWNDDHYLTFHGGPICDSCYLSPMPMDWHGFDWRMINYTERRIARDGQAYLYDEFVEHYGTQKSLAMWEEAAVCVYSAEQPVSGMDALASASSMPSSSSDIAVHPDGSPVTQQGEGLQRKTKEEVEGPHGARHCRHEGHQWT